MICRCLTLPSLLPGLVGRFFLLSILFFCPWLIPTACRCGTMSHHVPPTVQRSFPPSVCSQDGRQRRHTTWTAAPFSLGLLHLENKPGGHEKLNFSKHFCESQSAQKRHGINLKAVGDRMNDCPQTAKEQAAQGAGCRSALEAAHHDRGLEVAPSLRTEQGTGTTPCRPVGRD